MTERQLIKEMKTLTPMARQYVLLCLTIACMVPFDAAELPAAFRCAANTAETKLAKEEKRKK